MARKPRGECDAIFELLFTKSIEDNEHDTLRLPQPLSKVLEGAGLCGIYCRIEDVADRTIGIVRIYSNDGHGFPSYEPVPRPRPR